MKFKDMLKIVKQYDVPATIGLKNHQGACETVLDLERMEGTDHPEFLYRICASYPYGVQYNDMEKQDIRFVDFSGGPVVGVGDKLTKKLIVTKIINNLIYTKKL